MTNRNRAQDFDKYGPVAKVCLSDKIFALYRMDQSHKLAFLRIEDLRDIVDKACNLELPDELVPTFLLRRLDVDKVLEAAMEPATLAGETRLKEMFHESQWGDRISLYRYLTTTSVARQIAGIVFDSLVRQILLQGVSLTLVLMAKRSPPVEGEDGRMIQWEPAQNRTDRPLAASPVSVYIPPNVVVGLEAKLTAVVSKFEPNRLYVLTTTNRAPFDAFIMHSGFLYIFRIATMCLYETESKSVYAINDRIKEFFSEEMLHELPPRTMWWFVFVIPPRKRIIGQCKSGVGEFLTGVALFSAELDVERWKPMA